jgi:hypothetical protein
MFTKEQLSGTAWSEALAGGKPIQVSEEVYYYFLEVLPPVHMRKQVTIANGEQHIAAFGFAEGDETPVAFWVRRDESGLTYWACLEE